MQNPPPNDLAILLVDDDDDARQVFSDALKQAGHGVVGVAHARDALDAATRVRFDVAFVNPRAVGQSVEAFVSTLAGLSPDLAVVLLTAEPAKPGEPGGLRHDTWDVLPNPFTPAAALRALDRAINARGLRAQARDLQERLDLEAPPAMFMSRVPAMRAALDALGRAARADVPVVLRGAKGTGKKLLAWVLHRTSTRAERPFVAISCATSADQTEIAENLATAGRLSGATGGTLLLDEIHLLSSEVQAKLAQFASGQRQSGGSVPSGSVLRLIATTSVDLEGKVRDHQFRADLFDLLSGVEIRVPSLRERPSDIMPLARHFLDFFSRACGRQPPRFSSAFEAMLASYHWPGNVRELRNVVERAALLGEGEVLEPHSFAESVVPIRVPLAFLGGHFTLETIEREHILGVVARARTLDEAAEVLGIDTSTLWRKRKKYLEDHLPGFSAGALPAEAVFARRSDGTKSVTDGGEHAQG